MTVEEAYAHYQKNNYSNYRMLNDIRLTEIFVNLNILENQWFRDMNIGDEPEIRRELWEYSTNLT